MLQVAPIVAETLRTHHVSRSAATAYYANKVTIPRVDVTGQITFRSTGQIQGSGSLQLRGAGPASRVPRTQTDALAPYGQELAVRREILIGNDWWEIPIGRFGITEVTGTHEEKRAKHVLSWSVDLDVDDRFEQVRADDFLAVDSPASSGGVWDEIRRLSPWPVQEALNDRAVPRGTVYDNRYDAINTLTDLIGGVPHLTREGVLTARLADGWLNKSTPQFDINGVISWREGMSKSFYNQVQVRSSSDNDLVAFAQIMDPSDPLSVPRVGGRTYKHSSPIYDSQEAVSAAAVTILARVSTKRSRQVDIVAGPEALLLDLGDFGWFRDPRQDRAVLGEVTSIRVPLDPTAGISLEVTVAEEN